MGASASADVAVCVVVVMATCMRRRRAEPASSDGVATSCWCFVGGICAIVVGLIQYCLLEFCRMSATLLNEVYTSSDLLCGESAALWVELTAILCSSLFGKESREDIEIVRARVGKDGLGRRSLCGCVWCALRERIVDGGRVLLLRSRRCESKWEGSRRRPRRSCCVRMIIGEHWVACAGWQGGVQRLVSK